MPDWMLRMLMKKVRRKVITRAICSMHCILVVVRIRIAWAAVSLFARPVARPWRLKVELNSIFLRLIGVMLVLKEMNSAFQLGLHRSVCDGLISESFQMLAWFQTQQTRVLSNADCLYLCLIIKHLKVSKVSARNVSMKALFVKYLRFNVSSSVTLIVTVSSFEPFTK